MTDDSANTDDAASNPDLCISIFPSVSRLESGLVVLVSSRQDRGKTGPNSPFRQNGFRAA
jgi:hypothetical protein